MLVSDPWCRNRDCCYAPVACGCRVTRNRTARYGENVFRDQGREAGGMKDCLVRFDVAATLALVCRVSHQILVNGIIANVGSAYSGATSIFVDPTEYGPAPDGSTSIALADTLR